MITLYSTIVITEISGHGKITKNKSWFLFGPIFGALRPTDMNGLSTDVREFNDGDESKHLLTFFKLVQTVSHVPTREPLGAAGHRTSGGEVPVNQKVLCSLLHYLSVPASSPFKCSVSLGVRRPPRFDLIRPDRCLRGEHRGSCRRCRSIY